MEEKVVFSDAELKQLADIFRVLSEPSRLKILRALSDGEKCVTEIINATGLMQANVSKQIKLMERVQIVECRPSGLQRFYKIINPAVLEICQILCKREGNK